MRVLVLGAGSREHATIDNLKRSALRPEVYAWPFRETLIADCQSLGVLADASLETVSRAARGQRVDLVVSVSKRYLRANAAATFERNGVAFFGPNVVSTELEDSRVWARRWLRRFNVPSPVFDVAPSRDAAWVYANLRLVSARAVCVLKAARPRPGQQDVFICQDQAAVQLALDHLFPLAGNEEGVLVENHVDGEQESYVYYLVDGEQARLLGAVSAVVDPIPPGGSKRAVWGPPAWLDTSRIIGLSRHVLSPLLAGMKREHLAYRGFLGLHVRWQEQRPEVIALRVSLGDPDCQLLMASEHCDWFAQVNSPPDSALEQHHLTSQTQVAISVGDVTGAATPGALLSHSRLARLAEKHQVRVFLGDLRPTLKDADLLEHPEARGISLVAAATSYAAAAHLLYGACEALHAFWPSCPLPGELLGEGGEIASQRPTYPNSVRSGDTDVVILLDGDADAAVTGPGLTVLARLGVSLALRVAPAQPAVLESLVRETDLTLTPLTYLCAGDDPTPLAQRVDGLTLRPVVSGVTRVATTSGAATGHAAEAASRASSSANEFVAACFLAAKIVAIRRPVVLQELTRVQAGKPLPVSTLQPPGAVQLSSLS